MDLLEKTKHLCRLYDIKPARSRGQNFLIKEEGYEKIIEAADLREDDIILEVGPGLGFLTTKLAKHVKKVIAVELDDKLAEVLQTGLISQGIKNVEVVNSDILKISNFPWPRQASPPAKQCEAARAKRGGQFPISNPPATQASERAGKIPNLKSQIPKYKIMANLPYNITSIFLRKFLSVENKPEMMVLMLQKEVAKRITAQPPKMSLLAVSVQFYARAEIIEIVPASFFWPKPEVDSAIIKLTVETHGYASLHGRASVQSEKEFFRLIKIGFSAKRKMLKNNLAAGYHIATEEAEKMVEKAGFNPKIRAQELSVDDWIKLSHLVI